MIPKTPEAPSRQTMAELPQRAAVFLRAAVTVPQIRVALAAVGYDEQAHREGLDLLTRVLAWEGSTQALRDDLAAQRATREIEDFIHTHLPRLALGATRELPIQAGPIFEDLHAVAEKQPVLALVMLLDRLEALPETAPLCQLLARRGLDTKERDRLSTLLSVVRDSADPVDDDLAAHRDARAEAHTALWAWLRDWSFTARSVIRRKDQLIALGICGRRKRKGDAVDGGVTTRGNGVAESATASG